eukprot:g276.t1
MHASLGRCTGAHIFGPRWHLSHPPRFSGRKWPTLNRPREISGRRCLAQWRPVSRPRYPPPPAVRPGSFLEDGPLPSYLYERHRSTILRPIFPGSHAWGCLLGISGLNVLVFLYWQEDEPRHQAWMQQNFCTNLTNFWEGRLYTVATASISHQDPAHITGNMFALWLFSFNMIRVIGAPAYCIIYLLGGVACSVSHLFSNWSRGKTDPPLTKHEIDTLIKLQTAGFEIPSYMLSRVLKADTPSLGASGSVMAISAASAALFPLDHIRVGRVMLPLPIAVTLYVLSDLAGLFLPEGDNVDHAGHLGGLLMGALLITQGWYRQTGIFRVLHNAPTGGDLPLIFRLKQFMERR